MATITDEAGVPMVARPLDYFDHFALAQEIPPSNCVAGSGRRNRFAGPRTGPGSDRRGFLIWLLLWRGRRRETVQRDTTVEDRFLIESAYVSGKWLTKRLLSPAKNTTESLRAFS
jgi:hypothetical protein